MPLTATGVAVPLIVVMVYGWIVVVITETEFEATVDSLALGVVLRFEDAAVVAGLERGPADAVREIFADEAGEEQETFLVDA